MNGSGCPRSGGATTAPGCTGRWGGLPAAQKACLLLSPACRPGFWNTFFSCVYCDDYHISCVVGPRFTVNYPFRHPEETGAAQTLTGGGQPDYTVESHLGQIEVLKRPIQDGLKIIQSLNASFSICYAL